VVDASSPEAESQIQAVKAVLAELGLEYHPTLLVLNKSDRVPDRSYLDVLKAHHAESVAISAARGDGLDRLETAVREALSHRALEAEVETGVANGRILAYLAQHAQIHERTYDADRVRLHCRLSKRCLEFLFENGVHVHTNGQRLWAS
jgi:GTP-binding protein HflX